MFVLVLSWQIHLPHKPPSRQFFFTSIRPLAKPSNIVRSTLALIVCCVSVLLLEIDFAYFMLMETSLCLEKGNNPYGMTNCLSFTNSKSQYIPVHDSIKVISANSLISILLKLPAFA